MHSKAHWPSDRQEVPATFPFPNQNPSASPVNHARPRLGRLQQSQQAGEHAGRSSQHDEIFAHLTNVSRRIDDLARELNCLGFFDQDDDRPRAA